MNPLIHRNEDGELAQLEEKVLETKRLLMDSEAKAAELRAALDKLMSLRQEIVAKRQESVPPRPCDDVTE